MLRFLRFLPPRFRWRMNNAAAWRRYNKDAQLGHRFARKQFEKRHGYPLDLDHPKTHSERVYLRKLKDHDPRFTQLCDKVAARAYIDGVAGRGTARTHCVPVLAQADSFDALPASLWSQDVILKCTHGSGMNLTIKAGDTRARNHARRKITRWLGDVHGARRFERAYYDLRPSVIAEPLLSGGNIRDFKLFYYDGQLRIVMEEDNGQHQPLLAFYGPDWSQLIFTFHKFGQATAGPKPPWFDQATELAAKLAKGFDAIRVDLLATPDRFYLGEMTVYDGSGLAAFTSYAQDKEFARYWRQPHLGVDT